MKGSRVLLLFASALIPACSFASESLKSALDAIWSPLATKGVVVRGAFPIVSTAGLYSLNYVHSTGAAVSVQLFKAKSRQDALKATKSFITQPSVGRGSLFLPSYEPVGEFVSCFGQIPGSLAVTNAFSHNRNHVVSTSFQRWKGSAGPYSLDSVAERMEGTLRIGLAECLGSDLASAGTIKLGSGALVSALRDPENNIYIKVSDWSKIKRTTINVSPLSGTANTEISGRNYRFYVGTSAFRKDGKIVKTGASIARKNGTYWVPYRVFDPLL